MDICLKLRVSWECALIGPQLRYSGSLEYLQDAAMMMAVQAAQHVTHHRLVTVLWHVSVKLCTASCQNQLVTSEHVSVLVSEQVFSLSHTKSVAKDYQAITVDKVTSAACCAQSDGKGAEELSQTSVESMFDRR